MIEVHHLNESRSRRITWLLEELGLDYTVHAYQRNPKTRLAPPELEKIHPLGKAPVIRDGDEVIFESGAIIEYLVRKYGNGRLAPAADSRDYNRYLQFLHYAEGSAMLPLMLKLYTSRLGDGAAPLQPRIESEMQRHLGFLNGELAGRDYFIGNELTGADVQLSFAVQMAVKFCGEEAYPNPRRSSGGLKHVRLIGGRSRSRASKLILDRFWVVGIGYGPLATPATLSGRNRLAF